MPKIQYDPERWNQQAIAFEAELRELVDNHRGEHPTPWHIIATVAMTLAAGAAVQCKQWDGRFFRVCAMRAWRSARDRLHAEAIKFKEAGPFLAMFPRPHAELTEDEIEAEQQWFRPELQSLMRRARSVVHDETIAYLLLEVAAGENIRLGAHPLRVVVELTNMLNRFADRQTLVQLSPFAEAELSCEDFTNDDATPAAPAGPKPEAN